MLPIGGASVVEGLQSTGPPCLVYKELSHYCFYQWRGCILFPMDTKNCCLLCAFSLHLPLKLLHDLPPSSPHPFPSPSPSSPSSPSQSPLMKAGGQESTSLRQIFQVSRWGKLFKDKIYSCKSFMTLTVSTTTLNHPWLSSILPGLPRYLNPTLVTLLAIIGILVTLADYLRPKVTNSKSL